MSIYDVYGWFYDPVGWVTSPKPPAAPGKLTCDGVPCTDIHCDNVAKCYSPCQWTCDILRGFVPHCPNLPADLLGSCNLGGGPAGGILGPITGAEHDTTPPKEGVNPPGSVDCKPSQWLAAGGAWNAKNPCKSPLPETPGNPAGTIPGGVKEAQDAGKSTLDAITKFFQPCNLGKDKTTSQPLFTLPVPCWFGGLILVMLLLVFIRH
jgi:hypothetical protein